MTQEEVMIKLGIDSKAVSAGLVATQSQVKKFGEEVVGSFKMMGAGILAGFGFEAIKGKLKELGDKATEIKNQSRALGVSTDFYQGFGKISERTGVDKEVAYKGLEKLNVLLGEASKGSAEAKKKFADWGIEITDSKGNLRDLEDVFKDIIHKENSLASAAQQAALAHEFFGKSGEKLLPVLNKGSDAIDRMAKSWKNMSAAEVNTFSTFKEYWKGVGTGGESILSKLLTGLGGIGSILGTTGIKGLTDKQRYAIIQGENPAVKKSRGETSVEDSEEQKKKQAEINKLLAEAAEYDSKQVGKWQELFRLKQKAWNLDYDINQEQGMSLEKAKQIKELAELQFDIDKRSVELGKESEKHAEKLERIKKAQLAIDREIASEQERLAYEKKRAQEEVDRQYMPSLKEIADARGPFSRTARDIIANEQGAKNAVIRGDFDEAQRLKNINEGYDEHFSDVDRDASGRAKVGGRMIDKTRRVDGLKQDLRTAGALGPDDNIRSIEESTRKTNEAIANLTSKKASLLVEVKDEE